MSIHRTTTTVQKHTGYNTSSNSYKSNQIPVAKDYNLKEDIESSNIHENLSMVIEDNKNIWKSMMNIHNDWKKEFEKN